MIYFALLTIIAGVALAIQTNMNAYLGQIVSSAFIATFVALGMSTLFILVMITVYVKELPSMELIKTVPLYLWISSGVLGAFALGTFYFVIPKIGLLNVIAFSLTGQLIISLISDHYGWFNMPISTITFSKVAGVAIMIVGIFLINKA